LLKNSVILPTGEDTGDRVISEARRIWSLLLLPGPRESFPNIVFRSTVGRNTTTLFMMRLCDLADEITRSSGIDSAEAEFFSILLEIV